MTRRYLAQRLGQAAITIVVLLGVNFLLFHLLPGDPTRTFLPRDLTPAAREQVRAQLGLNLPLFVDFGNLPGSLVDNQFVHYVGNLFKLELGQSFAYRGRSVSSLLWERLGPTILLVGVAQVVAIMIGTRVGVNAGWRAGSRQDRISSILGVGLYALPMFWLGLLLLMLFASPAALAIFPTGHMTTPGMEYSTIFDRVADVVYHSVLPVTTLALGYVAGYILIARAAIINASREPYITTARAKGVTDYAVLRRHAWPNARLPITTLVALALGLTLAGAVGVEYVFTWPGLGSLMVGALDARDYPLLQGVFLLLSFTVVIANLIADIVYLRLDPRIASQT